MIGSKTILTAAALAATLAFAGAAQAATVTNPDLMFFPDVVKPADVKLRNYESAFEGGWTNDPSTWSEVNSIVEDTYLRGIFKITSASASGVDDRSPDGFELTGEFSAKVYLSASAGGTDAIFQLIPDSQFEDEYGTGAMLTIFHDTTPDFNETGTLATSRATAVDGDKYMVLGANDDWGDVNADGDGYYWGATGSATPGVSKFAASLKLLTNNSGIDSSDFLQVTQDPPDSGTATFTNESALSSILNEFGLQGDTDSNSDPDVAWDINSNDPLTVHAVVPLPAAAWPAMALLGALGFGKYRRMKKTA